MPKRKRDSITDKHNNSSFYTCRFSHSLSIHVCVFGYFAQRVGHFCLFALFNFYFGLFFLRVLANIGKT